MVGPKPWTFGGFFWGVSVFLTRPQSLLTGVGCFLEKFASESCTMAEVVAQQSVSWWPRSWYIGVATQPIRSCSGGVSRVFHIPGPTPNLV